jgi:histidinol-phosphate phosphatase family protein
MESVPDSSSKGLILLDRDGVLNSLVIDPEQGTVDSPLHPSQVKICPGATEALARLKQMGFTLALVTNQPAAAKGKTTKQNLLDVHERVLSLAQKEQPLISRSYICWHRAEENCVCRKPKTALLEQAIQDLGPFSLDSSWMVGDGLTDIQAGKKMGLRTALLARWKADVARVAEEQSASPDWWVSDLAEFTERLLKEGKGL